MVVVVVVVVYMPHVRSVYCIVVDFVVLQQMLMMVRLVDFTLFGLDDDDDDDCVY